MIWFKYNVCMKCAGGGATKRAVRFYPGVLRRVVWLLFFVLIVNSASSFRGCFVVVIICAAI